MKITCEMSGGFAHIPALSTPITVDTGELDPQDRSMLETLVGACRFFVLPPSIVTVSASAADYRTYQIAVQDGPRLHCVHVTEPIMDRNLRCLVAELRTRSKFRRDGFEA